jgi:hypothetical protein
MGTVCLILKQLCNATATEPAASIGAALRAFKKFEAAARRTYAQLPDRRLCSYWLYKSGLPGEEGRKWSNGVKEGLASCALNPRKRLSMDRKPLDE